MPNGNPPEERPRAKYSNHDGKWWRPSPGLPAGEQGPLRLSSEDRVPLAGLVEEVMRAGVFGNVPSLQAGHLPEPRVSGDPLPKRLIEELSAAQQQLQSRPGAAGAIDMPPRREGPAAVPLTAAPEDTSISLRPPAIAHRLAAGILALGEGATHRLGRLSRRMRPRDWQRRYLTAVSLIHLHAYDRQIERLLFFKTPRPAQYSTAAEGGRKTFVYQGPISGKVLNWALSPLPADLKRYAFIDFDAGNGRTLLLAARRNFEHAAGYAYGSESCEALEMNLAQYSRSYMSCRDVRALRADGDGIAIPLQPAVLFFPDSLTVSQLGIIMGSVADSLNSLSRPLYLIFENADAGRALDQTELFERVPLPLLNRIKALLFSPVAVAVYKSRQLRDAD